MQTHEEQRHIRHLKRISIANRIHYNAASSALERAFGHRAYYPNRPDNPERVAEYDQARRLYDLARSLQWSYNDREHIRNTRRERGSHLPV